MVSSTLGWPTNTCWKRRSRAASFSMCLRYSSSVVAPIMRSSPRASIGLSMLPASMAPSAAPGADHGVQLVDEGDDLALGVGDLLEHGLQALLELAAVLGARHHRPRSRVTRRLFFRPSGTSPSTMRRARPSTMAVLPTPGSPMRTGLFLVRRDSTWMTRRISSSRPMTGSSLPCAGRLGEVAPVLLERLVLLLGVLAGDPVAAPHLLQGGEQLFALDAEAVGEGQQQVLRWRGTRRAGRPARGRPRP